MNLLDVMQRLYKSEINFSISTFWDAGYTVRLGDDMNGFVADDGPYYYAFDEIAGALDRMARKHYPDSDYAKEAMP